MSRHISPHCPQAKAIVDFATNFHDTTFIKEVNESEGNVVFDNLKTDKLFRQIYHTVIVSPLRTICRRNDKYKYILPVLLHVHPEIHIIFLVVFDNLKTDKAGTTSSLAHVDLNATYEQITWGGLTPVVVTGVTPTITEIDKEYAVIHMSYVVESVVPALSVFRLSNTTLPSDSLTSLINVVSWKFVAQCHL